MKRPEAQKKLDAIIRQQRWIKIGAASFALILVAGLFRFIGMAETTELHESDATVTWSKRIPNHETGVWETSFEAKLSDGRLVRISSEHTQPPQVGQAVALIVRKDRLGLTSYKWLPTKDPALTPPREAR